ncbi:MAG TPA: hypothetical protein VNX68_10920 [Nitrosopumilaceae archaeon]|jgi:hypothetical protein|nr:hypothetical protein [Nitrosopumilaceae archaeon]
MSIRIEYQNISTVMTDAQVLAVMSAVAAQVNQDFDRYWDCGVVSFAFIPKTKPMDPSAWQFVVADTSNQAGAAGYHETGTGGGPIGYAFALTTTQAGMHPSVTISHEVLEMLGDPYINQASQWSDLPSALFLAYEVGDPVEDDQFGQIKDSILLSDFVFPSYFTPGSNGPWDLMRKLKGPWNPATMLPGAYQSTWDPINGWLQVLPASKGRIMGRNLEEYGSPLSRRSRRLILPHLRTISKPIF